MFIFFKLYKKCAYMAAHIVKNLTFKAAIIPSVVVIHNCCRLIKAGVVFSKNTVPELGITATTGSAYIKPIIKGPHQGKGLPYESHVRASSDLPDRSSLMPGLTKVVCVEYLRRISSVKTPVGFKNILRFCFQFSRQNKSGHGHYLRGLKGSVQCLKPMRMNSHIIIEKSNNVTR